MVVGVWGVCGWFLVKKVTAILSESERGWFFFCWFWWERALKSEKKSRRKLRGSDQEKPLTKKRKSDRDQKIVIFERSTSPKIFILESDPDLKNKWKSWSCFLKRLPRSWLIKIKKRHWDQKVSTIIKKPLVNLKIVILIKVDLMLILMKSASLIENF